MKHKSSNAKSSKNQVAKELCYSDSTNKRYRDEGNNVSLYNKNNTETKKMSYQGPSENTTNVKAGFELISKIETDIVIEQN